MLVNFNISVCRNYEVIQRDSLLMTLGSRTSGIRNLKLNIIMKRF